MKARFTLNLNFTTSHMHTLHTSTCTISKYRGSDTLYNDRDEKQVCNVEVD